MSFYQDIVAEYVRADRRYFVNPEFLLQDELAEDDEDKKKHWFVDLLAINLKKREAFLCEVTYAKQPKALMSRLRNWHQHWQMVRNALERHSGISSDWRVRPWLFVPQSSIEALCKRLPSFEIPPLITPLEMTAPWSFCTWNRIGENPKPDCIPPAMRE